MTDLKSKTVCVVDHGLFLPLALRLARDFKRVFYHTPQFENGFPHLAECVVGDGFDEIERCNDFWPSLDEIDAFVFPDIEHSGLQSYLSSIGKPVWGARRGDTLETSRRFLKDIQKKLGLEVPKFETVIGIDALRAYLADKEDKYIKISHYRGDMETFHHVSYPTSQAWLDSLAIKFGPLQNQIPFIVEEPVETEIETAIDTYSIDGKFPGLAVHGIERKDCGYLGSVLPYDEMPKPLRDVNAKLAPLLKSFQYRQFWAAEVRISNGTPFLIDPCCRHSSPAGEVLQELFGNYSKIIWEGAHGNLIDPIPTGKIGAQIMIEHKGEPEHWRTLEIPANLRKYFKLYNAAQDGERYLIPPAPNLGETIGSVVAVANTIREAVEEIQAVIDSVSDQPIKADVHCLNDALEEAHTVEAEGMKFSDEKLPEHV